MFREFWPLQKKNDAFVTHVTIFSLNDWTIRLIHASVSEDMDIRFGPKVTQFIHKLDKYFTYFTEPKLRKSGQSDPVWDQI